jgi:hypothetical protein
MIGSYGFSEGGRLGVGARDMADASVEGGKPGGHSGVDAAKGPSVAIFSSPN